MVYAVKQQKLIQKNTQSIEPYIMFHYLLYVCPVNT